MIYGEERTIAAHEKQNAAWAYDELLDMEADFMKKKAEALGFWQAEYEAGPLAGDKDFLRIMESCEQAFDEALYIIREQMNQD